ncbi:tRNA (adenosine(37)-N6)-threonylcarbamoyltransferase complex dimerization subunit type 1 TsaB [Camelliibacillus cellulosilyticus]|uniref:tRNA (Adenosine(37)-N6)-threonylcarbamoyltransferase complex dimerization subunit type 1 TsaB n=1 Tax=Camelliibacillus cellulosilyticus TaxID=2174486 RepID=A0ABV9GRD3_9BACL
MNVLAIDSSSLVMGVAIANEKGVLGEMMTNLKKNHAVRLMPAIEQLLSEVDTPPQSLNRIVVAEGPGSYTGVRIGVTIAKTMAWSLGIDLVGISTLEVLAQNGRFFNGKIVPLFDARRDRVYTGLYRSENGRVLNEKSDRIMPLKEWVQALTETGGSYLFLGNDLDKHWENIQSIMGEQAIKPDLTMNDPHPAELALLGMRREPVKNIHEFTPQYLQMAEAEAKWLEKHEGSR